VISEWVSCRQAYIVKFGIFEEHERSKQLNLELAAVELVYCLDVIRSHCRERGLVGLLESGDVVRLPEQARVGDLLVLDDNTASLKEYPRRRLRDLILCFRGNSYAFLFRPTVQEIDINTEATLYEALRNDFKFKRRFMSQEPSSVVRHCKYVGCSVHIWWEDENNLIESDPKETELQLFTLH
jgi:hypothetical protein